MSFIDRIRQKTKTKVSNTLDSPRLIKTVEVDVYDQRIKTCRSCDHLIKITNTCKKCGCFMILKAKLESASCPVGKW